MDITQLEQKQNRLLRAQQRYLNKEAVLSNQQNEVRRPFVQQITKLQKQLECVEKPFNQKMDRLYILRDKAAKECRQLKRQIIVARYQKMVPSDEEFLKLARYTDFLLDGDESAEYPYNLEIKRCNLDIPGFVIKACGARHCADRLYFAWKKNRLVGIMVVEPSQHAGDSTTAEALVYGKRHFKGECGVKTPLNQFVNLLKK